MASDLVICTPQFSEHSILAQPSTPFDALTATGAKRSVAVLWPKTCVVCQLLTGRPRFCSRSAFVVSVFLLKGQFWH